MKFMLSLVCLLSLTSFAAAQCGSNRVSDLNLALGQQAGVCTTCNRGLSLNLQAPAVAAAVPNATASSSASTALVPQMIPQQTLAAPLAAAPFQLQLAVRPRRPFFGNRQVQISESRSKVINRTGFGLFSRRLRGW